MRYPTEKFLSLLVFGLVVACSKDAAHEASSVDAAAASAASRSLPSSSSSSDAGPSAAADAGRVDTMGVHDLDDPNFLKLSLFGRLAVERENRPPETLTADAVFEAVSSKLSVPLTDRLQVAGFPVHAGYAARANTDLGVNLVVCEYRDAGALAKGKDLALSTKVERRDLVTVRKTWISVTRFTDSKESAAQARKILALLKTL